MKTNVILPLALALAAGWSARAVETKSWQQGEMADFERGKLTKLSLRNDGRLSLAPAVKELHDASASYLWACAQDSKGNLYVGGGSVNGTTEKLIQIDPGGKSKTIAELEGLEIHAIALDRNDAIYAATAPDGKVYRLRSASSKPEVFYDPKAKYIWALVFGANGDLFVATGDKGEIHRVGADGKGSVFFKTDETHIRSLTIDGQGNLIAGTEPGGLILRVGSNGEGFVLYQSPKREVTAVAVAKDGSIWAAAVGNKGGGAPAMASPVPVSAPAPAAPTAPGQPAAPAAAVGRTVAGMGPNVGAFPAIQGGTEVYRIQPDGFPKRVWQHGSDIVYSLAFDATDRPLLASGNKGNLYRIDSDHQYTLVVTLAPTQITSLSTGRNGAVYAMTGNIGKVFQIGPQTESEGSIESDVFDVGAFSYWGRLSYYGALPQGVKFETRSGNLSTPQKNWSQWATVSLTGKHGRVASPSARFLQYRATLSQNADLTGVDIAYQARNIAPTIEDIEITPPNYKYPAPSTLSLTSNTLSLPALGQKRSAPLVPGELNTGVTLNYAKGHIGARWLTRDENGDTLTFKVEIRGVQETEWKLIKDKLRDRFVSWDTAAYADGEYMLRVTANDGASNTPADTLTAVRESDTFLIDNTAPRISGLTARAASGGSKIDIAFEAKDSQSVIAKAEYSINGGDWIVAEPSTRLSDSSELAYKFAVDKPHGAGSEFTIAVRVTDEFDNQSVEKTVVK